MEYKKNKYAKFGLMMLVSFFIMYAVMFLNVFSLNHIMLSTTRTYMTILMVAPMAISMLLFMWNMYPNKTINYSILTSAALLFIISLFGLRNQVPIKDVQWMKAMIPHHSSAILTSSNATFEDADVQKLANQIIEAQVKEIAEMKEMIKRLEAKQ